MAKKPETAFRTRAQKDIDTLKNTTRLTISSISIRGIPDNLLCVHGRFVAVEFKTNIGKLEALQEHVLDKIQNTGGVAFVARPNNWKEIFVMLQVLDRTPTSAHSVVIDIQEKAKRFVH